MRDGDGLYYRGMKHRSDSLLEIMWIASTFLESNLAGRIKI